MSAWPPPPLHYNPPDKPRKRSGVAYWNLPASERHWLDRPAKLWFKIAVVAAQVTLTMAAFFGVYLLGTWWLGR